MSPEAIKALRNLALALFFNAPRGSNVEKSAKELYIALGSSEDGSGALVGAPPYTPTAGDRVRAVRVLDGTVESLTGQVVHLTGWELTGGEKAPDGFATIINAELDSWEWEKV